MKLKTALVVLLLLVTGCDRGARQAGRILDRLEAEELWVTSSTVSAYRVALDAHAAVQELARLDQGAAVAHERLSRGIGAVSDQTVAVCAYVIEKRRYREAVPTLEAYLTGSPGNRHHVWGPPFAVRALLVLKDIPDGSGGYQDYDDATIQAAVSRP